MPRDVPPALRRSLAAALRAEWPQLSEGLAELPLPTYVIGRDGKLRWQNASALEFLGDRRGTHFSMFLAPESRQAAQAQFASKLVGSKRTTAYDVVVVRKDGTHVPAEIESVALGDGDQICGVFGVLQVEPEREAPKSHVKMTPRQQEILKLLAAGGSTASIAAELHLSPETVRNHIRGLLRALGVHSRLQAVLRGHELGLV